MYKNLMDSFQPMLVAAILICSQTLFQAIKLEYGHFVELMQNQNINLNSAILESLVKRN